jgi:lipopolysaccharide assembly outer membrane protein LptD (OstA)
MTKSHAIVALIIFAAIFSLSLPAQDEPAWQVEALNQVLPGTAVGSITSVGGVYYGTNGVFVQRGNTTLMADSARLDPQSGEADADGHVRIQDGDLLWVGEHITYNFKTHQMRSEEFRTGRSPIFAEGENVTANTTNRVYMAQHTYVTTDDITDPTVRVKADRVIIVPGKYVEMWNAVVYAKGVPVFYFPYYRRNLGYRANNLVFQPGFRSSYGPYLLSTYRWYLGDDADGKIHVDYRERRGAGVGPDVNLQLGQWGEIATKFYYTHDILPNKGTNGLPDFGPVPRDRERLYFGWQATPATNLNVKALVNYQSDPFILHDFFEGDYRENPQPNTFFEANKYWENWSLDTLTTPRVNDFFSQVERLPDVKLTGFRQQIFDTPLYYDSESSVGYYRQFTAYTNGLYPGTNGYFAASAARGDTFHQVSLPWTFFDWLNVTPHVGGRFTYYSEESGDANTNDETYRTVFNTGIGTSFKASQLWSGATNSLLAIDGLRHIIEPSINYVYVPRPSTPLTQLPQFDGELPSLLLLPVEFPDYNDIDSIDSENVIRFGLRNTLQTKRDGEIQNLLNWNLLLDWRLTPNGNTNKINVLSPQKTFDDLYSELEFRPRTWLTMQSQVRYDINAGQLNLAFHQLTFAPGEKWSWGLGHWYLRGGTWGDGTWNGNNYITSTFFYRLDDNWGLRAVHDFNAQNGQLEDQFYTIYRDLRSWTAAVTFRVTQNQGSSDDYTLAFSLSLKASPQARLGDDAVSPYHLVGE